MLRLICLSIHKYVVRTQQMQRHMAKFTVCSSNSPCHDNNRRSQKNTTKLFPSTLSLPSNAQRLRWSQIQSQGNIHHPKKKQKGKVLFNASFYQCLLGHVASVIKTTPMNTSVFNFQPKNQSRHFFLQVHCSLQRSKPSVGRMIRVSGSIPQQQYIAQYLYIFSKPITIIHALIVKLKLCTQSSKDLVDKLSSTILPFVLYQQSNRTQ